MGLNLFSVFWASSNGAFPALVYFSSVLRILLTYLPGSEVIVKNCTKYLSLQQLTIQCHCTHYFLLTPIIKNARRNELTKATGGKGEKIIYHWPVYIHNFRLKLNIQGCPSFESLLVFLLWITLILIVSHEKDIWILKLIEKEKNTMNLGETGNDLWRRTLGGCYL